ncbi:MAG: hypothetical protein AAGE05_02925 [Pseudomonadota bacterium]
MGHIQLAKIPVMLAALAGLSGCTIYDGHGAGYYGNRYVGDGYPAECYDKQGYLYPECEDAAYVARNGYGYGSVFYNNRFGPYGWYDGFYYPGYSFYVYDRLGHRYRWRDNHRRHWEERRARRHARDQRREARREVRREARRDARREARREARRDERRAERRDQRRTERRENRRNRDDARNSYRGPYPPITTNRPERNANSGGRRGSGTARQSPPRTVAPTRGTSNTRQTQRMRNGPRETHPE